MGTERARGAEHGGKHSLYFNLVDAFDRTGCPICLLGLAGVYRWLDAFAYENVNDYDIRTALRKSKGFCTTHAWQLIDEVHDLVGAAIVYRDVIHTSLPDVPVAVHQPSALAPEGTCRACVALEESAGRYLDVFHESLSDREFRRAYASGRAALCRPHAQDLLARTSRRDVAAAGADLVAVRWRTALDPGGNAGAAGARTGARRYRGIAGANMTFSAASFAVPEPALLKDPTVAPVEMLVGRPRTRTLRSGLRTTAGAQVPPAETRETPEPAWEAVCEPGACPICRLTLADEAQRLGSRHAVDSRPAGESPALCNAHAWRLAERGHAAALSQTCAPAVGTLAQALAAASSTHPNRTRNGGLFDLAALFDRGSAAGARLAAALDVADECGWCIERAAVEAALLDHLLAAVGQRPGAIDVLARSGGLCRLHFVRAMERGQGLDAAMRLARLQAERWGSLRDDLEEYLRKQDYRYREEPRGAEQTSPWRATEQVAGAREIRP